MSRRAVVLSGSLGLGHDVIAEGSVGVLRRLGWQARTLNSMTLLGPFAGQVGENMFRQLIRVETLYDGLHFAHMRTGSRVAVAMDRLATGRLVPALREELARQPADLLLSVFATAASAVAKLKPEMPTQRAVVLCTDAAVHRLWAWEGTDLFLVTSQAAAASVRRFLPRALVAVVPPPVREEFYTAPTQAAAREQLGLPAESPCVLLMGGGWGLGPLASTAASLAAAGVHVLVVAGRNRALQSRLQARAVGNPNIHPFGFTDRIPQLMAASDLVISAPGATTCGEARVVGRQLVLLDVMPGHGRENLQHELELGDAEVCNPVPAEVTASVLAAIERIPHPPRPTGRRAGEWDRAFEEALGLIGVEVPSADAEPAAQPAGPDQSGERTGPGCPAGEAR